MARKNNQTVVMVTHDKKLTEYADKIINILDGKIESIEIQENSKEGRFVEPEKETREETAKVLQEEMPEIPGTSNTEEKGTPNSGFDIEYETRKLEEAAQQMLEEERKVKENESIKNDN